MWVYQWWTKQSTKEKIRKKERNVLVTLYKFKLLRSSSCCSNTTRSPLEESRCWSAPSVKLPFFYLVSIDFWLCMDTCILDIWDLHVPSLFHSSHDWSSNSCTYCDWLGGLCGNHLLPLLFTLMIMMSPPTARRSARRPPMLLLLLLLFMLLLFFFFRLLKQISCTDVGIYTRGPCLSYACLFSYVLMQFEFSSSRIWLYNTELRSLEDAKGTKITQLLSMCITQKA